jgi:AcrR family transcriptional regulator
MVGQRVGGRGKGLTRDVVVAAAIELVEVEGVDALTMRRVAARLEVEAMSLYGHIANKRGLIIAMADHLLRDVAVPRSSDPLADAVAFANDLRRTLLDHPSTTRLFAMNMQLQESAEIQRLTLDAFGVLLQLTEDIGESAYVFGTLLAFVIGHVLLELARLPTGDAGEFVYDPDVAFDRGVRALLPPVASPRVTARRR